MPMWTDEELRHEVSTAPYGAHLVRPDTRIVHRPDWYQVITPSANNATLNEVVFSRVAGSSADLVIDETIAAYRALEVPFKWCVWPTTEPADMGARLERHGFERSDARGMVCDPAALSLGPAASSIETREVHGGDEIDVYADVMATGWNLDTHQARADLRAAYTRAGRRNHCFLALHDGVPAGIAAYVLGERSGYLIGAVVLPAHRGLGLYRQLIAARLADIAGRGLDLATTLARERTSAPMLERMGFRTVCPLRVYTLAPGPMSR